MCKRNHRFSKQEHTIGMNKYLELTLMLCWKCLDLFTF